MKKIVLFTAVLAFIASSSIAVTSFVNTDNACATEQVIGADQGEKTKSKDAKKEESSAATTEKKSTAYKKSSCKKSCAKSCDKKGSKSKAN